MSYPRVHVVDHVTYCYTVFWAVGRDMVLMVSEPGSDLAFKWFVKRDPSLSNLVLTCKLGQGIKLLICNKINDMKI